MLKKITRKLSIFVAVVFLICNIGIQTSFAQSQVSGGMPDIKAANQFKQGKNTEKDKERYKKGELLVKYKSTCSNKSKVKDTIKKAAKSKSFIPEFKEEVSKNIEVVKVDENEDIDALAKELSKDPNVEYAQPNYIYHAEYVPQDERFSEQWDFKSSLTGVDIDATRAWDITRGSSSVVVGVIDEGIAYQHPDLANNIYKNPDGTIGGWDFVNDDSSVFHQDEDTHGTHVAGTIAACANTDGVIGVAPNVKIMPLRVLNEEGEGYTSDIIEAVDYASQKGVNILNLSLGGPDYSQAFIDIINANPQILFVVAAGNDGKNLTYFPQYPAGYDLPNMLVVSSIDSEGSLSYFSNYGPQVDIAAPGSSILSTTVEKDANGNIVYGYGYLQGTSMATPHVAGVAALIKSQYPNASVTDIINKIKNSAAVDDNIIDRSPGGLVLDAYNSLNNFESINITSSRVTEDSVDIEWQPVPGAASYVCQTGYSIPFALSTTFISTGSLIPNTSYAFRISALNSTGQTIAEKRFIKKTLAVGTGTGLKANYFDDASMNTLEVSRSENVDFDWGSGSPDSSINNQSFSALWNGELEAKYTEEYILYVQALGAFKLWVDGNLIINRTTDDSDSMVELSEILNLQAGKHYPVQIEYYETAGNAGIKLLWSSASQEKEVVPASRLYQTSIFYGVWYKSAISDYTSAYNISHSMVEGGKMYVVSNEVAGGAMLEVYDEVQNKFVCLKELAAKLPDGSDTAFNWYQASTSLNGEIYLFICRSFNNVIYTTVQVYDIATGTLTDKSTQQGINIPDLDCALTVNGQIYVFGGGIEGSVNQNVRIYNPVSDTWTTVAQMPDARWDYSLAQLDGKVYMFGGKLGSEQNTTYLRSVYVFDPQNNSWTQKSDMPDSLWGQGSVAVNGKILVYGGYIDLVNFTEEGNVYDPQNDTWSPAPDLLSPRGFQAMEYFNGKVYSIFGMYDKRAYNYFDVLEQRYAATYEISGYIEPDVTSSNPQIKAGFKVEIEELGKSAVTDQNGYFQITGVPSNVDGFTLKVTKDQYLMRRISNVKVKASDVQISTSAVPVDMWAGDIVKDNAINMTDIYFLNSNKSNPLCDLNQDGVVDTLDISIIVQHINTSTESYPNIF